jgi:tetratricopeptide (TPR) repeat protein
MIEALEESRRLAMSVNKIVFFVMISFMVMGTVCSSALWASQNEGANYLVQIGERDLKRGNIPQAMHEFSKALMLDPSHKKALAYMNQFGFQQGLYSGASTRVTEAAAFGLAHQEVKVAILEKDTELINARKLLDDVQRHRDRMSRELTEKNLQLYVMETKIGELKASVNHQDHRFEGQVNQLEKLYASIEQEIAKVRDQEVARTGMAPDHLGRAHAYENELIALQREYNLLRENEHQFHQRQQDLYHQIDQYVNVRTRLIDDLADELIYKDLDIVMKESHVLAKLDQIEHLDTLIEWHRKQLANQYQTIQEQQEDIKFLREKLSSASGS